MLRPELVLSEQRCRFSDTFAKSCRTKPDILATRGAYQELQFGIGLLGVSLGLAMAAMG